MTGTLSSASGEPWRGFDVHAQSLAHALRAGRLTVLVGAAAADKTTLLVAGVLPLLRRRAGDGYRRPAGAPAAVASLPERRSRTRDRDHGELLHFVDQWIEAPLDSLLRALGNLPATAAARLDLAAAMTPEHLSALGRRHGGAHLLFVFDHFESLLEGAKHRADLHRFLDAWAAVVQARDLDAHFLVAVDEHAWSWLQALWASTSSAGPRAFRLQMRAGDRVLESLTDHSLEGGDAQHDVDPADFAAALHASLAQVVREARPQRPSDSEVAAALNASFARLVPEAGFRRRRRLEAARDAAPSGAATRQTFLERLGTRLDPAAAAVTPDDAALAGRRDAAAVEAARAAREAEAARQTQARQLAEAAAKAAEATRDAEAARQAEAARRLEAERLARALAEAEAMAAREAQARQAVEAAANAAEAERRAQAQRRAEAEQIAEAARQVEAQRLAQALAEAEARAAREVQARQAVEAAANAAEAERRAEADRRAAEAARAAAGTDARRGPEAPPRVQQVRGIAPAVKSLPASRATAPAAALLQPAAAAAGPVRTVLRWGAALVAAFVAAAVWWPGGPTPPAAPAASPTLATAPALPQGDAPPRTDDAAAPAASPPAAASAAEPTPEPAPAAHGRYEALAVAADGTRARMARELAGALSTAPTAVRVVPVADGADPITWLRAPGRLAIARLDALREARGPAAPPLRVLTPLFSEAVLFVVRADSPLKYIRDLGGRRLSIGPVRGDESHTVREIYRRLFGREMTEPVQLETDQALAELLAFRSIDAMAVVEPRPLAWWASLDPGIASRLRLLTLNPRHPADRKLMRSLGAVRVAAGGPKGRPATTPTVMSYLVASGERDADVDRLTAMARALCRELPRLRKQGDPIWRQLTPMAQLDTGWPVLRPFQSSLSRCARRQELRPGKPPSRSRWHVDLRAPATMRWGPSASPVIADQAS